MATIANVVTHSPMNGIRFLDTSRDLYAVADLVELCFADTMDAEGRRYLREMRALAHTAPFWQWMDIFAEPGSLFSSGYVWEEDGKVVGNISLFPFYSQGHRCYLIANVVVHPDYRARGIGRALTAAGLDYARNRGIYAAWLQVRDNNPSALHIYLSLGFQERTRRTTWQSNTRLNQIERSGEPDFVILLRRSNHWPQQQVWLKRLYPPELAWHLPVDWTALKPGLWASLYRLMSLNFPRHLVAQRDGQLLGALSWHHSAGQADQLWLAIPDPIEEAVVQALLVNARWQLSPRRPLTLNFPAGLAVQAFQSAGFESQHTLIWMEYRFV
jgi:ribosomal-protein-alanine N-acetyltransferase